MQRIKFINDGNECLVVVGLHVVARKPVNEEIKLDRDGAWCEVDETTFVRINEGAHAGVP